MARPKSPRKPGSWLCKHGCRKMNDPELTECWNCGLPRPANPKTLVDTEGGTKPKPRRKKESLRNTPLALDIENSVRKRLAERADEAT